MVHGGHCNPPMGDQRTTDPAGQPCLPFPFPFAAERQRKGAHRPSAMAEQELDEPTFTKLGSPRTPDPVWLFPKTELGTLTVTVTHLGGHIRPRGQMVDLLARGYCSTGSGPGQQGPEKLQMGRRPAWTRHPSRLPSDEERCPCGMQSHMGQVHLQPGVPHRPDPVPATHPEGHRAEGTTRAGSRLLVFAYKRGHLTLRWYWVWSELEGLLET